MRNTNNADLAPGLPVRYILAMTASRKQELRPLPMRITQLQYERLLAARARDGLSIQEHVRRSLDAYLAKIERDAVKAPPLQSPEPDPSTGSGEPPKQDLAEVLKQFVDDLPPMLRAPRKPAPRVRTR